MSAERIIRQRARKYGIDPRAAIAVALGEGGLRNREGDIGDLAGGGSYGPFQLYAQGALPRRYRGRPQAADAWAWSPEGIDYALSRMVEAGAKGLTGREAVETIIRRFERPADPEGSIRRAISRYGGIAAGGEDELALALGARGRDRASMPPADGAAAVAGPSRDDLARSALLALLQERRAGGGRGGTIGALSQLADWQPARAPAPVANPRENATAASAEAPRHRGEAGGIRELFYDPAGAYDEGRWIAPIGGHDDHVHVSFGTPQAALNAIWWAKRLGLAARENPYTDPVDPVHVGGSYHYRTFPGRYNGRRLGRGLDVSGSPEQMRRYFDALKHQYRL